MDSCPFCHPDPDRVFYEGRQIIGLWDAFPVSPGHALLVTRRHVAHWFAATPEEQLELLQAIEATRRAIHRDYAPDGFNIGTNVNGAAGQTVFHLHVHVIPRYHGDVEDPRGGVRHVIPSRANYLTKERDAQFWVNDAPHDQPLVSGGSDPLLPHLQAALDKAIRVDIAAAFVMESGVHLIAEHLRDLLVRKGRVRFLTGDYLGVTDPQALLHLLDLEGDIEIRVFETKKTSFHPKAYILHYPESAGVAFVGSSNLTRTALLHGLEWNYRVVTTEAPGGFQAVAEGFEALFHHPSTRPVDYAWIEAYRKRRKPATRVDVAIEEPEPPPNPHPIQEETLTALEQTRKDGNSAGLVVLATGLGKTWLSAFDSNRPEYERILFVAHRDEILTQAMRTYRRIRPSARLGKYTGTEKLPEANILFASIQTLGRLHHLKQFDPETFDYIVVDEFHHAAARTYRNLIGHFNPKFLLGLTATPERTDGGDLLALCQENLVYRCDMFEGIRRDLLSPFQYWGVPDEVDYTQIPWRSSRFDEEELTRAVATQKRARNALDQYRKHAGGRTLAFCCSKRHADFMAEFFQEQGLRAVSIHSGPSSAARTTSLEQLERGDLDVICCVDMFNEGVDLPHVDTVMMLRPTESSILWMQQFGRGLRKAEGKEHLAVIDYIGNHRIFLTKPRTLFGLGAGDRELVHQLKLITANKAELPPGCSVTYDLKTVEILRSLVREPAAGEALEAYYQDFRLRHSIRPSAVETFHEGHNPRKTGYSSWFHFVNAMGDLSDEQEDLLNRWDAFLEALQKTPMTKSYKMVTLLALLDEDAFPGGLTIEALTHAFARRVRRSAVLQADVGVVIDDLKKVQRLLKENPINAWVSGKGTKGRQYFEYTNDRFSTTIDVAVALREHFQEMVREIVDWRLAEYLDRVIQSRHSAGQLVCKVSHSGGKPILFLPDRGKNAGVPYGDVEVEADGQGYMAKFVKIAVNVMREPGTTENVLPDVLRRWFGPDAGLPGTNHRVVFKQSGGSYVMAPSGRAVARENLEPWRSYSRDEIPPLFGFEFSRAIWNQGFVIEGNHLFLLVTLDKAHLNERFQYQDRFIRPDLFQWQSQNRTTQHSKHGQLISNHADRGYQVHLFIRRKKMQRSRAAPFIYCGDVDFVSWEGEKPITVQWRLKEAVPEHLKPLLKVPS